MRELRALRLALWLRKAPTRQLRDRVWWVPYVLLLPVAVVGLVSALVMLATPVWWLGMVLLWWLSGDGGMVSWHPVLPVITACSVVTGARSLAVGARLYRWGTHRPRQGSGSRPMAELPVLYEALSAPQRPAA